MTTTAAAPTPKALHAARDWPEHQRIFGPTGFEYVWTDAYAMLRWFAPNWRKTGEHGVIPFAPGMDRVRVPDVPPNLSHALHYRRAIETLRSSTGRLPRRIVDAHSNTGQGAAMLADAGADVRAFDPDPKLVDYAIARYGTRSFDRNSNPRFAAGDARWLDTVEKCDAFVCIETLSTLPPTDIPLMFGEAARLLEDGGTLYLTTPCQTDPKSWPRYHFLQFKSHRLHELLKWFEAYFTFTVQPLGIRESINPETGQIAEEPESYVVVGRRLP